LFIQYIMKKISVILFITGVIVTIALVIYFRSQVDPVDSDSMVIDRSGHQVSRWPIFIGIILWFVGSVFYYVSHSEKHVK
jgi:multisubunit Na+/H+ antiporter MnhE subunit